MGWGLRRRAAEGLNRVKHLSGLGNSWTWVPPEAVEDEIAIAPLVYPLRYDILVRRSYFEFYARHRELYRSDFDAYLESARGHPYFQWFTRVVVFRFHPGKVGHEAKTRALFAARLRAAAALHDSISARGFTPAHPIIPYTAEVVLPSTSGRVVRQKYYMGDGCHRLACLMSMGYTALPREYVRVRCFRRLAPLDNTALLAGTMEVQWPDDLRESARA